MKEDTKIIRQLQVHTNAFQKEMSKCLEEAKRCTETDYKWSSHVDEIHQRV